MSTTLPRPSVRGLLLLVAFVASVLAAERWGEHRARRHYWPLWKTISVNKGSGYERSQSFNTHFPDAEDEFRAAVARLRAEGADFRVSEEEQRTW